MKDKNNMPIDVILETQTDEQPLSEFRSEENVVQIQTDWKVKGKVKQLKREPICPGFELDANQDIGRVTVPIEKTEKMLGEFEFKEKEGVFNKDFTNVHHILYPDNSIYIGTYNEDWIKEGVGTFYLADGSKYVGQFEGNSMNGEGRFIYPDGDYYQGMFVNNLPHGDGKFGKVSEGVTYTGSFKEGLKNGSGEETRLDGSYYKGSFSNDMKHGRGHYTWSDGSVYEGSLKHNEVEGFGRIIYSDSKLYLGNWNNNKIEGLGVFYWPDGKVYAGYYINDKKSGFGIFLFPNGKKFEGYWLNGKQHGLGICSLKGVSRFGEWRFGKRIRWILNDLNSLKDETYIKHNINEIKTKSLECADFLKKINILNFDEEEIKEKLLSWSFDLAPNN